MTILGLGDQGLNCILKGKNNVFLHFMLLDGPLT